MRWACLAIALLLACGGGRSKCELSPPINSHAPFLWRVSRDGGAAVWFYGTIHNTGAESVPKVAWAALEHSQHFASELGNEEPDPDQLRALVEAKPGQSLQQQLPPDDWYDLRDALRGTIKEAELKRVRPWYAMTRLSAAVAPGPTPTMDVALAERAEKRQIPVDALESYREQLAALAETVTIADLQEAIHVRETMACEFDQLKAGYVAGDLVMMERLLVRPTVKKLLEERNKLWMPKLEPYFTRGGGFVAVGLGHLLGEGSLLALLTAGGYTVERVTL